MKDKKSIYTFSSDATSFLQKHPFCLLLPHLDENSFRGNGNKEFWIGHNFTTHSDRVTCESISYVS